jgi:putative membrane protein
MPSSITPSTSSSFREPIALSLLIIIGLVISGFAPYDRTTWALEVFPIVIALPVMALTARSFPLTPLLYRLIFLHMMILMVGGHYTYARVPLGFWMQDAFDLARNHYDRIGHFAQGFIPAMIAREILLRRTPLARGKMLFFIIVSICLAISASYELLEWGAAVALGQAADEFLGTQGDVWDTQIDMVMALIGALSAQIILARRHDQELKRLHA